MRLVMQRKLSVMCLLLGMASPLAQARDGVLTSPYRTHLRTLARERKFLNR